MQVSQSNYPWTISLEVATKKTYIPILLLQNPTEFKHKKLFLFCWILGEILGLILGTVKIIQHYTLEFRSMGHVPTLRVKRNFSQWRVRKGDHTETVLIKFHSRTSYSQFAWDNEPFYFHGSGTTLCHESEEDKLHILLQPKCGQQWQDRKQNHRHTWNPLSLRNYFRRTWPEL